MEHDSSGSRGTEPEENHGSDEPKPLPRLIDLLSLGVSSALCLIIGTGIGYGIDALAGTSPVVTFVGLAFGMVSAVLITVVQVRRYF